MLIGKLNTIDSIDEYLYIMPVIRQNGVPDILLLNNDKNLKATYIIHTSNYVNKNTYKNIINISKKVQSNNEDKIKIKGDIYKVMINNKKKIKIKIIPILINDKLQILVYQVNNIGRPKREGRYNIKKIININPKSTNECISFLHPIDTNKIIKIEKI